MGKCGLVLTQLLCFVRSEGFERGEMWPRTHSVVVPCQKGLNVGKCSLVLTPLLCLVQSEGFERGKV